MIALKFLIPEIFLSLSTFTLLMVGVFLKKSFEIVYRLSILVIFLLFLILLTGDKENTKVFNESFLIDEFSLYSKVLILISAFFILLISKRYITDIKNDKFEYFWKIFLKRYRTFKSKNERFVSFKNHKLSLNQKLSNINFFYPFIYSYSKKKKILFVYQMA